MQSAHACACFVGVALSQQNTNKSYSLQKHGAILDSFLARNRLTNAKNWHLGALGCNMEGQGAFWGAKWRGKAPFGVQNGGSGCRLGCKMEGPGAVWGAKWRVRERSESMVAGTALAHWVI